MNQSVLTVCRVLMLTAALVPPAARTADADPLEFGVANFFLENSCCDAARWKASLTFVTTAGGGSEFFIASSALDPVLQFSPTPADLYQFGEAVDLSRRFFTIGAQPGIRGGAGDLEPVFFTADFQITAPDLAVGVTVFVPYVWAGSLTIASDAALSNVLFSGDLRGTGEATMRLVGLSAPGQTLGVTQIVYGGDRVAPVPEPTTAALLGAGLLCAFAARRGRRRKA